MSLHDSNKKLNYRFVWGRNHHRSTHIFSQLDGLLLSVFFYHVYLASFVHCFVVVVVVVAVVSDNGVVFVVRFSSELSRNYSEFLAILSLSSLLRVRYC